MKDSTKPTSLKVFEYIKKDMYLDFLTCTEDSGFDVNARSQSEFKQDYLSYAVFHKRKDFVIKLIDLGADLNAKDAVYQKSPIHWAASNQDVEMIELLVEYGADPNSKNKFGYTFWNILNPQSRYSLNSNFSPVFEAIEKNDLNGLQKILKEKPHMIHAVTEEGNYPIHAAVQQGNLAAVKMLMDAGADPTCKNLAGFNAIKHAKKSEIVELFKDHGHITPDSTNPSISGHLGIARDATQMIKALTLLLDDNHTSARTTPQTNGQVSARMATQTVANDAPVAIQTANSNGNGHHSGSSSMNHSTRLSKRGVGKIEDQSSLSKELNELKNRIQDVYKASPPATPSDTPRRKHRHEHNGNSDHKASKSNGIV